MANPANNSPAVTNYQLRSALLATALRQRKDLGAQVAVVGGSSRIKLFNVGILTGVEMFVSLAVTIGTAVATVSQRGPYNLISRVRLTDYDGTDRINLSGYQLWVLNSVRANQPYGYNNDTSTGNVPVVNPNVQTAVAAGVISFWLYLPLAYNLDQNESPMMQDLTGCILAQTAVGELYVTLDWNPTLLQNGNIEAVYSGGATSTAAPGTFTVQLYQDYLIPQPTGPKGQLPMPGLDLMTVYELNGNLRTTANLAQNSEVLINYPNVRRVIGAYVNFVNNGAMASTDVSKFRILVNGNNVLYENSQAGQFIKQRLWTRGDLQSGTYYFLNRDKPVETALFGNVQLGVTPSAAIAGNAYMEIGFESFYTKGSPLPGLVQGS